MPRGPRLKVALRAVGVPRRHARYPRNGDSGTADRLLRCAARFRVETAVAAQAHAIVTRDDDLKGDPLVAAYAQQHGIQLLTVQRLVDMLA